MRYASTIIVLILAAAGVWAMLHVGFANQSVSLWKRDKGEHAVRRLLTRQQLPIDALTHITIRRADQAPLVFERSRESTVLISGGWNQVEPFDHPMELFAIRQLALQALEVDVLEMIDPARFENDVSAASLSLQPPLAVVTYDWAGGSLTIELGRRSVAGRAYLRLKGENAICVVTPSLHERALEMDDKEWRRRTIFSGAGVESSRIEWQNGPALTVLVRDVKQWKMLEPAQTRLDPAARDAYLDALGRAAVSGFILDQPSETDLAKFGLVDSPVSLTITGGVATSTSGAADESNPAPVNPQVQRLIIGSPAGGATQDYFGMVEGRPVVVRISGAVLAALFRQPQDLVALTGSGVNPADVKSVVIRTSQDELRLERDLERWQGEILAGPAPAQTARRELNASHVQELLNQMTQLRALGAEFVEQYPRELEFATVTLYGYNAKAIDTIRIIKDAESGQWGMENGDNVVRIYPAGLKMRLTSADFGLK